MTTLAFLLWLAVLLVLVSLLVGEWINKGMGE
jgi:hypothetical protein